MFDAVNQCGLDVDIVKNGFDQFRHVFLIAQRLRRLRPAQSSHVLLDFGRCALPPHKKHRTRAKRPRCFKHPKRFLQHAVFASSELERLMTKWEMMHPPNYREGEKGLEFGYCSRGFLFLGYLAPLRNVAIPSLPSTIRQIPLRLFTLHPVFARMSATHRSLAEPGTQSLESPAQCWCKERFRMTP
jgi:hypothetical protein